MKETLVIIGNGFDLAHDFETSYNHFKEWLCEVYEIDAVVPDFSIPEVVTSPSGDDYLSMNDKANVLFSCMYDLSYAKNSSHEEILMRDGLAMLDWSNFEEYLGQIPWYNFLDEIDDYLDKEGDVNYYATSSIREDSVRSLSFSIPGFVELVKEWLLTVDTCCKFYYPFVLDNLKDKSKFLSFDYTDTLSKIYGVDSRHITHIHGTLDTDIVIGFRKDEEINLEAGEVLLDSVGFEEAKYLSDPLVKPSEQIIKDNSDFFIGLQNIKEIYSWGFSYSEADIDYVKKICSSIDSMSCTWYLNDYDGDLDSECTTRNDVFRQSIIDAGFKGKFKTYHALRRIIEQCFIVIYR